MESLILSSMSPNQGLTIIFALPETEISTSQTGITCSVLVSQSASLVSAIPYRESNIAITNLNFFLPSITPLFLSPMKVSHFVQLLGAPFLSARLESYF